MTPHRPVPQPLPRSVIDVVHTRLLVRYGSDWLRLWEGVDIDLVKSDWAEVLAGVGRSALEHALRHLPPDRPPKADQFRALCLARPEAEAKLLPAPAVDPEKVKADQERVRRVAAKARAVSGRRPGTAWIAQLLQRQEAGQRLSPAERAALQSVAKQGLL